MRGLVRLEVIKHLKGKKERKTQVGHNMISNGGLSAIAAKGIEDFLGGSSYFGGRTSIKTTMMVKYEITNSSSSTSSYGARTTNETRCLSCALLGISASAYANIDSRRGFLPLMDNTGAVGTDAVRAKASVKAIATNDRGISMPMNGSSFVDVARNGRKYGFPAGTGDGDITGVAMVASTALNVGKVPWGGLRVSRRVDDVSGFIDKVGGATLIVPPGIDGNGASVRMKFTTANGVTVHSRSLITGEQTDGAGTEWFPTSSGAIPAYDDGRYIYQVFVSGVVKCRRYDKQNNYSLSQFNLAGSSSAYYGDYRYFSFYDTGNGIDIWVMYSSSQRATVYHTATSSYEEFVSKTAIDTWVSTNYGMTIPSALSTDTDVVSYIPGTLGSNKALFIGYGTYDNDSYNKLMVEAWIFSNATSIVSSLVNIIQCLGPGSILWCVNNVYGVIEKGKTLGGELVAGSGNYIGYSSNGYPGNSIFTLYGNDDYLYLVADAIVSEKYGESYTDGCYISMQGQWTNWMSVKALEETVTKSSATEILVEYDYAFEGSSTTPVDPLT